MENKARKKPIIIAHRGASGYLPEHSQAAKTMAYAMGADYLEQDVAITRDNRALVIHDRFLDTVTDVATSFPERKREDGRYYVIDFDLREIKQLTFHERINLVTGNAVYPDRFPLSSKTGFILSTLEEEIELIQGLNKSTGKNVGIYPEIKVPWFHRQEGVDAPAIVLDILEQYGYADTNGLCYLQCFDPETLCLIRNKYKEKFSLVQLIADNSWNETPGIDYSTMLTPRGLDAVSEYADAIGPWNNQVLDRPELVALAHERGLLVHPFTARADSLPDRVNDYNELVSLLLEVGVDGFFTDFPDRGVAAVARAAAK